MSRDIPIIFSASMVLALLAGRKTMTRRLAWTTKVVCDPKNGHFLRTEARPSTWHKIKPGDRCWVRENWRFNVDLYDTPVYMADFPVGHPPPVPDKPYRWRPSIHLPRRFSRITLVVSEAKIERLQDISEEDAIAEGWQRKIGGEYLPGEVHHDAARDWFSDLWESLHGVESWRSNPEIIALRFDVQKRNIDSMAEAA